MTIGVRHERGLLHKHPAVQLKLAPEEGGSTTHLIENSLKVAAGAFHFLQLLLFLLLRDEFIAPMQSQNSWDGY